MLYGAYMQWPLINILELHDPNDTEKSQPRAFGGRKLNELFAKLCTEACNKMGMNYKQMAKENFNTTEDSLMNWRGLNKKYPDGHPIPLSALGKVLELLNLKYTKAHRKAIQNIKELRCGRIARRVKAQIYLMPELAKLCGAHAADGCLYGLKDRGPIAARWDIGDQEKANIEAARMWVKNLFGVILPNITRGNMAYTVTSMQVMARYLIRIFDFPIGEKSKTVSEPRILVENDKRILSEFPEEMRWKLRLEFAKEVINFDGHSTESGGVVSVGLGSESDKLRESITQIFRHFGINLKNYNIHKRATTTARKDAEKFYSIGIFRGQKGEKLKRLLGR